MPIPKISCLMASRGRPDCILRSLKCFAKQTYPNKELIVLSQGSASINDEIRGIVAEAGRSDIQFVEAPGRLCLGAMRNLTIELATGTILCQWDDDDLYHPLRLITQYNHLAQDGVIASLYTEHLKYFEDTSEIYWVDWSEEFGEDRRCLPGTVMFRKSLFYKARSQLYPERGPQSRFEEDWSLVKHLCSLGRLALIHEGQQYIYTFHGKNTYWRSHHEYALNKRVYSTEELTARRFLLEKALADCGVNRPVAVRSLEDVAFEYRPEAI